MRREGYELQVSPPKVLLHEVDGKTMEPMEHVVIDVPTEYQGSVMQKLGSRKGELVQMAPLGSTRMRVEPRGAIWTSSPLRLPSFCITLPWYSVGTSITTCSMGSIVLPSTSCSSTLGGDTCSS